MATMVELPGQMMINLDHVEHIEPGDDPDTTYFFFRIPMDKVIVHCSYPNVVRIVKHAQQSQDTVERCLSKLYDIEEELRPLKV